MIRKIARKLKIKYYFLRNFNKYINYKNIDIKSQNQLNAIGEIDFSKTAKVIIGNDIKFRNNFSLRCRDNSKFILGDRVYFNNNCTITCRKKIKIGNDVSVGPNVIIFDHDHDYKSDDRKNSFICDEIIISDNVWIGGNVVILKGTHIGKNSVIAAGTVVKGSIPPNTLYINKNNQKIIEGVQDE